MAELSAPGGASSSNPAPDLGNPVATLATRLSRVSLEDMRRVLGKDVTVCSRIRSGERDATLQELARLIPLCGLKLVPVEKVCVDRKAYEAMSYIAHKALADQATSQRLIWDEGEEGSDGVVTWP